MNNCTFIGNLTRDPEGVDVGESRKVKFGVAVNERFGDKETTFFGDFEAWNGTGKFIETHFKKGDAIVIAQSSAKYDTWEDKQDGTKRSKVYFRAERVEFPPKGGKRDEGGEAPKRETGKPPAKGPGKGGGKSNKPAQQADPVDDMDIPF